jgi:hypothetical protein
MELHNETEPQPAARETEKLQFTYSEPDTRDLARPGRMAVTIEGYSAAPDDTGAVVVAWRLRPVSGAAIEYETSTVAMRGNRLARLLSGVLYQITDAARLNPDWLVGLNFVAEIVWQTDDGGVVRATARPVGEGDNPKPYPWEDARAWEEQRAWHAQRLQSAPMCQTVV